MNFRLYPNELFKEFTVKEKLKLRYAVSNYGRIVSFSDSIENGRLLKNSLTSGYQYFRYVKYVDGKRNFKGIMVCKLVAQHFLERQHEQQEYVLHLDYNRANDTWKNLKWATYEEKRAHVNKSPLVVKALTDLHEKHRQSSKGHKLTESQVIILKKKLLNPNRKTRLKILARQFGVSEMTLHRIRTGENWGHIRV